jgi:hypothetical protein
METEPNSENVICKYQHKCLDYDYEDCRDTTLFCWDDPKIDRSRS